MKTGTKETIGTSPETPSNDAPQPCWKTATTTPYAAPMDSKLNAPDTNGTQSERNATISSSTLSPTTRARKTGGRGGSCPAGSRGVAVAPPTYTPAGSVARSRATSALVRGSCGEVDGITVSVAASPCGETTGDDTNATPGVDEATL